LSGLPLWTTVSALHKRLNGGFVQAQCGLLYRWYKSCPPVVVTP
jgi:hypothetical protein